MARNSRTVYIPRSTVPIGMTVIENTTEIIDLSENKNDTIQIEDESGPIETKGFVQYLNFLGAGVTCDASGDPNTINVTIPGGGGGGSSEITASATWDFGTNEADAVVNTVLSALLTTTNFRGFTVIPTETTATSLDDFKLNGVTFNIENIVDSTSFDIRATAVNEASGVYTGTYKVLYA